MLGLISTPDPRYGGNPDPDEERERRWEPINWRISVSMTLSLLCLIVSGATPVVVTVLLHVSAIVLCGYAMRVAWPAPRDAEAGRARRLTRRRPKAQHPGRLPRPPRGKGSECLGTPAVVAPPPCRGDPYRGSTGCGPEHGSSGRHSPHAATAAQEAASSRTLGRSAGSSDSAASIAAASVAGSRRWRPTGAGSQPSRPASGRPPRRRRVQHAAEPEDVRRLGELPARDLLGRQVPRRPVARLAPPRAPREGQVEQLDDPDVDDHVRRLEVQVQPPVPVQVADRRAELHADLGDLDRRHPPGAVRDGDVEPLAPERLEHDRELGLGHDLVRAHEVRVGELEQQPPLALEPLAAARDATGSPAAAPSRRSGSRARRSRPRRRRAPGCGSGAPRRRTPARAASPAASGGSTTPAPRRSRHRLHRQRHDLGAARRPQLAVEAGTARAARRGAPVSTTRPRSSTAIRVASRTVSRSWAITIVVRPAMSRRSGSRIRCALCASRPVVGSSSSSTGASRIIARATAIRWRWPPDSRRPRWPTRLS